MPLMPPAEFVASATQRGFIFSVKPGGALGVKPPPGGSLTDPMRKYVSVMKAELLALLQSSDALLSGNLKKPEIPRENKAPELCQLVKVGEESPHQLGQVGTKREPQLGQVGAKSQLSASEGSNLRAVLAWACSEARRGFLPEPAEALPLPSGNVVPANGAAAWLLAAESRSVGMDLQPHTSIDCTLALGIVQRDMEHIARWSRHARLWADAPYTHAGAASKLQPVSATDGASRMPNSWVCLLAPWSVSEPRLTMRRSRYGRL